MVSNTIGQKICTHACAHMYSRSRINPNTQEHIIYCKVRNKVIKEAIKQHYCRLIEKSDSKIKTTWNIKRTGKLQLAEQIPSLLISKKVKVSL
jgi:hypothetical protein